ncbi:MAG: hypothetical protein Q3962_06725 [Corynebacterium sp.]|nr:hypothetical protein [Corynebacterium sp.]
MLHATLYYHKAVPPPQVRKILADFSNLGDFSENFSNNLESTGALEPIRLAVISPDKSARENFEKILEREIVKFQKNSEFPGEEGPEIELISATTFADVVVAIPPPHGWKPADIEALKKVHAHVGRLIIEDSFVTDSAESVLSRVVELASSAPANPDFFPFFKNGDSTGGPVVAASEQPLQPPQPGTKSGLYAGGIHGRMLISLRDPIARRACVRSLVRGPKVLVETVAVAVLIAVFGILLLTDMIGAGGFLGIGILAHRMYSRWYGLVRDWLIRHPEYDPDGRAQWISQTTKEHK